MEMFNTAEQMQKLIAVAEGRMSGDLLIQNVNILDVFTEQIFKSEILISDGKIASITQKPCHTSKQTFDAHGLIALPGFMDCHFHLDFPLVTPAQLSYAIVPHGTTAMLCEILDFAALNGLEMTKRFVQGAEKLPYRCFWAAPGKVAPKFITEEVLNWPNTIALGEMAQPLMEAGVPDELHKIELSRRKSKVISGHVVRRNPEDLDIFAILGYDNEHNTDTYEEALARMRFGMSKIIRINGAYDAAKSIITGALRDQVPTDQMLFAVDDVYIHELFRNGHIDTVIQRCIELGLPPVKAIKIATLNAARHFHLDHILGSITPGRFADLVLVERLDQIKPQVVFQNGKKVAENGKLTVSVDIDYGGLRSAAVPGLTHLQKEDLCFTDAECITNRYTLTDGMPVAIDPFTIPRAGFYCNTEHDELPFYRIARYARIGTRKIDKKVVIGTGIRNGAIACSFEQGGSAVNVVGDNVDDILTAIHEVDRHAGCICVVSNGNITARFPLPLGASMSELDAFAAAQSLEALDKAVHALGCRLKGAVMRLYFLPFLFCS